MINRLCIFIGGMRCGSTAVYHYLPQHPRISAHATKDPHFFSSDDNWSKGPEWYLKGFESYDPEVHEYGLDASTHYTKYPTYRHCPERIRSLSIPTKLIYGVRDPVERAESHLVHNVGKQYCDPADPESRASLLRHARNLSSYAMQLDQYTKHFSREDIYLMDLDALKSDPEATLNDVTRFLGLDDAAWEPLPIRPRRFRADVSGVRLTDEEREGLASALRPDVRRLRDDYGFDVSTWWWV